MLGYVTDLMEDAQDFGWPSAKGAHALILCRMEEGKVNWLMSDKLDRLRRVYAQKIVINPSTTHPSRGHMDIQGMICKVFQTGKYKKVTTQLMASCTPIFVLIVSP